MKRPTPPPTDYGLRNAVLSPMETLAQSVSTMAPTTTPVATIPLVCALAGNGTWLAYVLATAAVLLVALCIARYARYSASPGSLYTYVSMTLPALAKRPRRMESAAGLRSHRIKRHRRLLSLRKSVAPRCHRTRNLRRAARDFRHRRFHGHRLARRENFRPPDALDRSSVGDSDFDSGDPGARGATACIGIGTSCT